MNRREFLASMAASAAGLASTAAGAGVGTRLAADEPRQIHTVTGPVSPSRLGLTLVHEHVMVDFAGADVAGPHRYDLDEVEQAALPHLERIRGLGCRTLLECTPAYLGRDARLLQRLAARTGLNIVTNTGYYGFRSKYLPEHALTETDQQIAERWIREWERGIDGTGARPGFIKTSVNDAPLSAQDAKLIRAAALTHRATGLTVASHTGTGAAALEEIGILESEGVKADAFIWVHAHNEKDTSFQLRAARRGAWVSLDGLREQSLDRILSLVETLAKERLLGQVLVSSDAGWYHVGEPGGGAFRPLDFTLTQFVPRLRERLGEAAVKRLLVENPARALT